MKTNAELFLEMCELQEKTDQMIFEKQRMLSVPSVETYVLALVDEVGELNHELKPQWCWWKAQPGEVDWTRVLDEIVDIWHFCLSLLIQRSGIKREDLAAELDYEAKQLYQPTDFLWHFNTGFVGRNQLVFAFNHLIGWGNSFGFDFPTVYEAYKKKNEENNERAQSDY
ncbi:dUTP diphosphatase [uncultured Dubosiella sp.]|uniref:dUTP diphosphatase n=1 Tax=uncultured Dubosiella sp. TaxID=1937011 RepID=UPI002731399D|nr:dUTP diphosphatase [uncultured Dubosiella sp.]